MKKKILGLVMAGVMVLGTLTGCGATKEAVTENAEASEAAETSEKKVLRVGMECAYAPFNWTQVSDVLADGEKAVQIYGTKEFAYGYDVMMAQKIATELGWELEIHKVEWDSIGMALDSNKYDCIIAGMGKTAEREQAYTFTEPYYYRDVCVTVKKGSEFEGITKLSDFASKNVKLTTQLGTAWVDLLAQIPDGVLGANYATTAECFMAVSNGAADAAVIDVPTSQSALLTNSDLVMLSLDESDTIEDPTGSTNVCIAVRKDDTQLRDEIQGAMDKLGWSDKAVMDEMMNKAIDLQPAAN